MFVNKHISFWRMNYLQCEQTFAYNYTRSFTLNLLKIYRKPKRNMISQSVLVLIITQFFLILHANSGLHQYQNRGLTNSSKSIEWILKQQTY